MQRKQAWGSELQLIEGKEMRKNGVSFDKDEVVRGYFLECGVVMQQDFAGLS